MIQHVTREVAPAQLDQCIAFYERIGFRRVPTPASLAGRAVWLQNGATQVHLMPKPDATRQSGHIGVVVERYEQTVASLRELGHEVEPRQRHWGSPRAYVRDPAGNLVELMEWPPGGEGGPAPDGEREQAPDGEGGPAPGEASA